MKFYLGIDIGGTKIRAVLAQESLLENPVSFEIATPHEKNDFLEALKKFINGILENREVAGIGVGLPGIVDTKKGILIQAPNLPFLDGWRAKKFFKTFADQIMVDNDSRCFLRAETKLGAAQNCKNAVALTIGTGIGGGIMVNKKIYSGSHNSANEFGHMIIDGHKTLEQLAGKKAFLAGNDTNTFIGIGVANIINSIDPETMVLGGGGITSGAVNMEVVEKIARKFILSPMAKETPIVKGSLGENAQALGAILLLKI